MFVYIAHELRRQFFIRIHGVVCNSVVNHCLNFIERSAVTELRFLFSMFEDSVCVYMWKQNIVE